MKGKKLLLASYLTKLGYGTRKQTEEMLASGRVTDPFGPLHVDHQLPTDGSIPIGIQVDGADIDPEQGAIIVLNKPEGFVCSTQDQNPLIYDLLPIRFKARSPIMAPVGRLDKDTTGLILITDDGQLLHRLTSPKFHLPKTYRVTTHANIENQMIETFASGKLMLDGETKPLRPADLKILSDKTAEVTITEGRYHQVRRMFAAHGNLVTTLKRISFGPIEIGDLEEGKWKKLSTEDVELLKKKMRKS